MNYKEQLKDNRWQVVAAKIKKRDGCCQKCRSKDRLEVHHLFYTYRLMAWEYNHDSLVTLCRACHEIETDATMYLKDQIKVMLMNGIFASEIIEKLKNG